MLLSVEISLMLLNQKLLLNSKHARRSGPRDGARAGGAARAAPSSNKEVQLSNYIKFLNIDIPKDFH